MSCIISFIIPYCNTPFSLLKECLQSIVALPLEKEKREIIVVDDGNVVPLEEMMRGEGSSVSPLLHDITIIRLRTRGIAGARNAGMDAAKGEFLQFVDATDYLIPHEEMRVMECLEKGDTDVVMFHSANRKRRCTKRTKGIISGARYMHGNDLRATACLYVFRNTHIRFTERILHADELFTSLLIIRTKRLQIIDAKPVFQRDGKGSEYKPKDKRWRERSLNDMAQMITYIYAHEHAVTNEYDKEAFRRKIDMLCMDFMCDTWRKKHSMRALSDAVHRLKNQQLYPLPFHFYTLKYSFISAVTKILDTLTPSKGGI